MKRNKTTGRKRIKFQVNASPESDIYVSGSFNDWNASVKKMKDVKGDGRFTATAMLFPGEYEYKFVVDGDWKVDQECPRWVRNDFGTLNSLLKVS